MYHAHRSQVTPTHALCGRASCSGRLLFAPYLRELRRRIAGTAVEEAERADGSHHHAVHADALHEDELLERLVPLEEEHRAGNRARHERVSVDDALLDAALEAVPENGMDLAKN